MLETTQGHVKLAAGRWAFLPGRIWDKIDSVMRRRLFTLEEALGLLTWLEEKFRDMDLLREELGRLQDEASQLVRHSRSNGSTGAEGPIGQAQKRVEEARLGLTSVAQEIQDAGIIVRGADQGLVDFLSVREGQEVFLCWVRGEDTIGYWHGTNEGYLARKAL